MDIYLFPQNEQFNIIPKYFQFKKQSAVFTGTSKKYPSLKLLELK